MTDGVARGDGFGTLFFSLGLDELLTAVREAMRDFSVDINMICQEVHAVGSTDGPLASGAHVPVTDELPLTLVAAPSHAEIDALARMHEERCGSRSGLGQPLSLGGGKTAS